MDYKNQINKYYNDLFIKTEHINLLKDSSLRNEVLRNIDWTDPNTKKILTTLASVDSLHSYTLPDNRKKFIELIKTLDLNQDQKEFLISFEEDLGWLLSRGGGGGSGDPQPNNKDNSEEMKKMIREGLNAITTVGLILNIIVQSQANSIEQEKLEFSKHELSIESEFKEENIELDRQKLELLKEYLEDDDAEDFNQVY